MSSAEVLACIDASTDTTKPLTVHKVGPSEFRVGVCATESFDRLAVELVGAFVLVQKGP
jgi:hypothetical protein